ncbi:hypothetical protein [Halomonas sp. C05BenzN]|uniref:hypothetical protein n=1 Tax=Halomonas sp. C05BenzN TaxID=3411041 RepID=UPI003B92B66E
MAENKLEQQKAAATKWFFIAAVGIPVGFGLWFGWVGPWWLYLAGGVVIFVGGLGGWMRATQEDDVHRAVTEMNERQRAAEREKE